MPSILGAYTALHVTFSLFAIIIGVPAIFQMLRGELKSTTIFAFFLLTALTSLTGFGFPASSITPCACLRCTNAGLDSHRLLCQTPSDREPILATRVSTVSHCFAVPQHFCISRSSLPQNWDSACPCADTV